jgi:hypothetical protein
MALRRVRSTALGYVLLGPAGPKGRVSVTNGIAAAGNSATEHPDAVRQVLAWMGRLPSVDVWSLGQFNQCEPS